MNIMMNTGASDDRFGHHDQAQSSETTGNYKSKHRVEYETSPPMLIAMSIGCVVVLLATVIGCSHMCADCDPCISCSEEDEPYLTHHQLTSLEKHEALIQRLTEYPELLQSEENQLYIVQITEKQMKSIYKSYCFYFVNTPSHRRRNVRALETEDDADQFHGKTQALPVRSLRHVSAFEGRVGHGPTPATRPPLLATSLTNTPRNMTATNGHLLKDIAEDSHEDRLRKLKETPLGHDDFATELFIQGTSKQPVESFAVKHSSGKYFKETRASSKNVLPRNLGPSDKRPSEGHQTGDRSSKQISKIIRTTLNPIKAEIEEVAADPGNKRRKRRHEDNDEDGGESDNDEEIYDDNERGDSQGLSDDEETICSGRTVEYPVVLYINAAGNLVQLIQSESHYQPFVNERCRREFYTTTRGNLTVTCFTTYRLAQVYALNLATRQFGREIIRMTQCTPVHL